MTEFDKRLPVWKALGTEPPISKVENGWKIDERPPADYMNYLHNKTYEAIQELQENAAHKEDIKAIEENVTNAMVENNNKIKDIAKINIIQYPRLNNENHDIPRINRAITYLNSIGGGELLFNAEEYLVIPQKPAPGDTTFNANSKRIRLRDNVSLTGKKGGTVFKVSDNNPNYHALVEEEKPSVEPIKNVTIKGITFDHNVYNNTDKPEVSLNNPKECFRIYKSENLTIKECKFICNGINSLNIRMGLHNVQEDANNGIYPNKKLTIENNEMVFIALDLAYFDNTFITTVGEDVLIRNNKITSIRSNPTQKNGENTAIEVNGKNIDCSYNVIDNHLLGVDILSLDTYDGYRNIKIHGNEITNCARGIKLWTRQINYCLSDVKIYNNSIVLNQFLYKDRQEMSTRCGIGISNHSTASLGIFKNVNIEGNKISMDDSARDYLLTLSYPGSYYLGLDFDATFNGIYLGGASLLLDNFTIKNNEFKNLSCPAMFFGHNAAKNFTVGENWFVNCGYGKRSAIMAFSKYLENLTISNNNYVDTGYPTMNGNKMYSFASSANGAIYKNIVIGSNKELIRSGSYIIDKGDLFHTISFDYLSNFLENYSSVVKSGLSLTNSITNGSFTNGTTYWNGSGATLNAINNTLMVIGSGTTLYTRASQITNISCTTGKKIYVKCRVRVTNNMCNSIQFIITGTIMGSIVAIVQSSPLANQWYDVSTVLTIPSTVTGSANILIGAYYPDNTTANGKALEIQNIIAIDLTAIYGTGNEPLTNRMTSIVNDYFNGWFDNTTGISGLNKTGNAANRPLVKTIGTMYFDMTLGKPIWWDGTYWKDSTGANA
ncbi:TPA: hypothetical protein ACOQ31_004811 [Bacillus cereus]